MERLYDHLLKDHFATANKMAFLSGPRQVGKTTTSRKALSNALYLNWDVPSHRALILKGPEAVFESMGGAVLDEQRRFVIFDEIHKFPRWKNYLKGFFDLFHDSASVCITGSARLSAFRYGGDSLMGRYFPYRMHPLSVREIATPSLPEGMHLMPRAIDEAAFGRLLEFGGFPEPFIRSNTRFYNRWSRLRLELLFKEDLRDLTHISDVARIRTLADLLAARSGGLLNYSHLANDLQVSVDTVRRWVDILEELYFCFRLRPYSNKIARSLVREPKVYLWDWSLVKDPGARFENMVASHLLKATHFFTDAGLGTLQLHYLRDKQKREVDFAMIRDDEPWFIAEAKLGGNSLTESLSHFQKQLNVAHAFQVVLKMPFVDKDCFTVQHPVIVPARTFLSQLV
jgi:predicted AAA+ superfamily ATPase